MTSGVQPEEPDWSLLPYDAVGFFQLESGYERNDLRRAYNRLIRTYKPERYPAEFQKIRAAFEQLDNGLRYGRNSPVVSAEQMVSVDAWQELVSETGDVEAAPEPHQRSAGTKSERRTETHRKSRPDFIQRIVREVRRTGPAAVFDRLNDKQDKSPAEYYVLALLSDATASPSIMRFIKCLMAGLRDHPGERGLSSLLYATLRQQVPAAEIPTLLKMIAKVIRTDEYYSITEPLWDQLLNSRPIGECIRLLTFCESQLQDFRVEARQAFYLHILRTMVWKAESDWLNDAFRFLEEESARMSYSAEAELDLLTAARAYVEMREEFVRGDSLRQQMDYALEAYFTAPAESRDFAFVQCQIRMASNADELMDAFPMHSTENISEFLNLWNWVGSDVRERVGNDEFADSSDIGRVAMKHHMGFMRQLQSQTKGSGLGRVWDLAAILIGFGVDRGLTAIVYTALLVWGFSWLGVPLGVSILISLGVALVATWITVRQVLNPAWQRFCRRMATRCYHQIWRGEVMRYLGRSRLSLRQFFVLTQNMLEDEMYEMIWVLNFFSEDEALPLYAEAQLYLS